MFVGMGGSTGQLEAIVNLCDEHKLRLIIDAAHMAGTRLHGAMDWIRYGDATCFSFQSVKNLPTADGGMVCFNDGDLDRKARQLSWLGIDKDTYSRVTGGGAYKWKYEVADVGWKYHGNAIMAAIGLVGLQYLDQDNAYRRQIAKWYDELLRQVDFLTIPLGCESSRHLYQVMVDNRDQVILALNAQGIYCGMHYRTNTDYPMYHGDCPQARFASDHLLSLPMHLGITHGNVQRIADAIREISQ
jgi:dTDP-4-amino-4,6-dideoxygalactose transaminase